MALVCWFLQREGAPKATRQLFLTPGAAFLVKQVRMSGTVLALIIEEVGHNCWVLEVYLLGI